MTSVKVVVVFNFSENKMEMKFLLKVLPEKPICEFGFLLHIYVDHPMSVTHIETTMTTAQKHNMTTNLIDLQQNKTIPLPAVISTPSNQTLTAWMKSVT
jgi:hypothetical protein